MVERDSYKVDVDGSIPSRSTNNFMTLPTIIVPIGVSCEMIVEKDGEILMGKRGNIFGQGSWALPAGHLELGEKLRIMPVVSSRRKLELNQ